MKNRTRIPINVISSLKAAFNYYLDENIDNEELKREWLQDYKDLLHAYHVYVGIKKDYRKKK